MTLATEKKKISAYISPKLDEKAKKVAEARGMSLSTLVSFLLSREVRQAEQTGEIED